MKAKKAVILLNGPDLLRYQHSIADLLLQADYVFGFSYGALTNITFTDFIYEAPILDGINERALDPIEWLNSAINNCCFALASQIPIALMNKKIDRVYLNSSNSSSFLKTLAPSNNWLNFIKPNYFFVNEATNYSTCQSLRYYFNSSLFLSIPINYRCSCIRALSLAYLNGSEIIHIYGMSPSTPRYFLLDASIQLLMTNNSYWQDIISQWKLLEDQAVNQIHFEYYNSIFDKSMVYNIFLYIKLLISYHQKVIGRELSIKVFSEDPLVLEAAASTGMQASLSR